MKVFLDANILFSAADPASATRRLLETMARRTITMSCPHGREEARRNLQLKRPEHLNGQSELKRFVTLSYAFALPPETDFPPCDVPIPAGAIGSRCTHLWTRDKKHFGRYYGKEIASVGVVSSVLLADELES